MSAPPPNYSSLDRYGNEVAGSSASSHTHGRESSADSVESVTLLLGDAVPDLEDGVADDDGAESDDVAIEGELGR